MVDTDQTTGEPYDLDNPPESQEFSYDHIGRLTKTARVDNQADAEVLGIGDRYSKFNEAFIKDNGFEPACWLLVSEALNVIVTEDEMTTRPAEFSQLVRLQNKSRGWLGTGQAPDILAKQFRETLGVTASWLATERADTAVGKVFYFQDNEIELGGRRRKFKKNYTLWPSKQIAADAVEPEWASMADGAEFTYDGITTSFRIITPGTDAADVAEAADGPKLSEEQTVGILVEILEGKTPAQMSDVVINEARLKNVDTVFGVPLFSAAVDESLATILQEKGLMTIAAGGLLRSAATPAVSGALASPEGADAVPTVEPPAA